MDTPPIRVQQNSLSFDNQRKSLPEQKKDTENILSSTQRDTLEQTIGAGSIPVNSSLLDSEPSFSRKGTFFFSWGYNRSAYNRSDIHFQGPGYDFTLDSVTAHDRPSPLNSWSDLATYLNPAKLSIPQYNVRLGYFFDDKHFLTLGLDHMKYVVDQGQQTSISGNISPETSVTHAGQYNHTPITIGRPGDVLNYFDHTNGVNLVDVELGRAQNLLTSQDGKRALAVVGTVGVGVVVPHSDNTLFDVHDHNNHRFHLAGVGASASLGLRADLCNLFFVEGRVKGGYINFMDALTVGSGRANHEIGFIQPMFVAGLKLDFGKP